MQRDVLPGLDVPGVTATSIQDFEVRMEPRAKDKILHSFRGGQKFWRGKEWTEYGEIDI